MSENSKYNLITKYKSPNFIKDRINPKTGIEGKIKFLVLHHTAQSKAEQTILEFESKVPGVSSHYITDVNRDIYQIVDEKDGADHAGVSYWRGERSLNYESIGIEQTNLDGNIHTYTEDQIEAVTELCKDIIQRYNISPINVVAHSDIAPNRKIDPGFLFPWDKLAENGVGAYPKQSKIDDYNKRLQEDLRFLFKKEFVDKGLIIYGYDKLYAKSYGV